MGRAAARSQNIPPDQQPEAIAAFINSMDDEDRQSIRDGIIRELRRRRGGVGVG